MRKRRQSKKKPKMPLDKVSGKRAKRGRRPRMLASEIRGRAESYRFIFDQIWDRLWPLLSTAASEENVIAAFQGGASPYTQNFVPGVTGLVLKVVRDPKFPKERREAQINFLADSLAGVGVVTPRRSRDICAEERAKQERATHIIRYEYYIECSCGYKGRSRDHACPKCGAKISFLTMASAFAD